MYYAFLSVIPPNIVLPVMYIFLLGSRPMPDGNLRSSTSPSKEEMLEEACQ